MNAVVDLTREISTDVDMWPNQPGPRFEARLHIEPDGVFLREVSMWEHTGTHLDAPAHFFRGAMTVDRIPVARLVCPVVVFHVNEECLSDPDYVLTVSDVERHEAQHGRVRAGSAALVCTGWDAFVGDGLRYAGRDESGRLHFPGVSEGAARLLVEERGIVGLGIDTLGVDAGLLNDFPVHRRVTLPNGVWNLEELVRLGEVPPTGAWVAVGVLPLVGGSGAPARVFALLP